MSTIPKTTFDFLKKIDKHNNRDWFTKNKHIYQREHGNIVTFADEMITLLNKHDVIETASGKKSVFRIYRDVRFSKNKSPYKNYFAGIFSRATKARRGTYYFHLQPGHSYAGGGFWGPEPHDLKRIREEFAADGRSFRKMISAKKFKATFGKLQGEQLKTTPKGFEKDHPEIDLIRYKQFLLFRKFSDKEVLSKDFAKKLNETFKAMRPFLNYMSEVLTTDVNGISLLG